MKILLISPIPPPAGGIATWTKLYMNSNKAISNNIKIVNTSVTGNRLNNYSKKFFKDELGRAVNIYSEIKKSILDDDYDIIHLNTSCSKLGLVRDYICAKIAISKGASLITHCHCDTSYMVKGILAEYFFKKLCRLSSKIICLNSESLKHIKFLTGRHSIVVPNFLDNSIIENKKNKVINTSINNVIYVGHIIKTKGCDDIIKIAEIFPDISFKLIGYLSDEIKEISVTKNVEFTGEISKDQVIKRMKEADLLLFPSHTEGFPNVVLEAMACGLPIVSTKVGAIPDMIEDLGGKLVEVGDIDSMVKSILDLQNKEKRKKMSDWNLNKVSCYSIDIIMDKIFEVYKV